MSRKVPIKFAFNYTLDILRGEKTLTARYGFDRPVSPGDFLLMEKPNGDHFANAVVEGVAEMTVFDFAAMDADGHRSYADVWECIEHLNRHYPDAELTPNTDLTVISWSEAADPANFRWMVMSR